jgi:hypothetical protein
VKAVRNVATRAILVSAVRGDFLMMFVFVRVMPTWL